MIEAYYRVKVGENRERENKQTGFKNLMGECHEEEQFKTNSYLVD